MAEVLLVDGSGILHHRHAGIASHLGVVASMPDDRRDQEAALRQVDIEGMAPGESRPVVHEDQLIGVALRPTAGSRRPIFISPGHRVDVPFCERAGPPVAHGRRLPEPLYWADRLSKAGKKDARSPSSATLIADPGVHPDRLAGDSVEIGRVGLVLVLDVAHPPILQELQQFVADNGVRVRAEFERALPHLLVQGLVGFEVGIAASRITCSSWSKWVIV